MYYLVEYYLPHTHQAVFHVEYPYTEIVESIP